MKNVIVLAGRVLLAAIFVTSGLGKLGAGFAQTQHYMQSVGMSATAFWLTLGVILELGGGVMVLLGLYARIGALMLIVFLVPVTFIFHADFADQTQMIMFMKNISMTGGLVLAAVYGGGEWTIDRLWR